MTYFRIGFTGTRLGMTADQLAELRRRLSREHTTWTMFSEFHHGDCVGADEEAHDMMRVLLSRNWPLRVELVIHPPKDERWRAHCAGAMTDVRERGLVRVLESKGYLERDRDIVDATDLLIACPKGMDERGHGGTWYTIRYARALVRPILIIWGDGSVTQENWDLSADQRAEKLKNEREKEREAENAK